MCWIPAGMYLCLCAWFFRHLFPPQGSVFPRHEHVSGADVYLLLVLCNCGHGHRWHDLQVHRIPGVCLVPQPRATSKSASTQGEMVKNVDISVSPSDRAEKEWGDGIRGLSLSGERKSVG